MRSIIIDKRFCGPPSSANGGYVCGLLAGHIGGSAEITLRAPPPLGQPLDVVDGPEGAIELRQDDKVLANGRSVHLEIARVPAVAFAEAEAAVRRTPYDESSHKLSTCFVCGPARAHGDGLRIFSGPLTAHPNRRTGTLAATWVPCPDLAGADGLIAPQFVWAAMDCPTGFAGLGARHLGLTGEESILLGRMSARIDGRPEPGDRCVVVAWPTGRDGRKLFASAALLAESGLVLAVAQATWLTVERHVQLGQA